MKTYKTIVFVVLIICCIGTSGQFAPASDIVSAQQTDAAKNSQESTASKTAVFSSVSKTDTIYKNALDAHDIAGARKLIGESGAFKGTVSRVFQNQSGSLIVLDFDPQYKTALTAVLRRADFAKFPDMKTLDGKEIVVTGKFIDYKGDVEILLIVPEQVKLVAQ